MDLARDDVDVAIRFGEGDDEGLYCVPVSKEWLTPAMSPELAAQFPTPESLMKAPLIYDDSIGFLRPPCNWPTWFKAVGIDHDPVHGLIGTFQSNCWVNLQILGQPCEFYLLCFRWMVSELLRVWWSVCGCVCPCT